MKKSIIKFILTAFYLSLVIGINGQNQENTALINDQLKKPWGKLFYIERINGEYKMGDPESHYNNCKDFEHLTFDISNHKVLANMGIRGTLKNVTFYRDSYFVNNSPIIGGGWSGVWAGKDNSSYGPYSFSLEVDGENHNLDSVDWDFKTGLLDNLFPITKLNGPNGAFTVQLITFAPISSDGRNRVRGLVYGMHLENNQSEELKGIITLPVVYEGSTIRRRGGSPFDGNGDISWALYDPFDFEIALGDTVQSTFKVPFNLKKGESIWVPVVINNLGDDALDIINSLGTAEWLKQTHLYFRNMLGRSKTSDDLFLTEFYERQVLSAFGSIAMSASGKIAGSNWGSYPATRQIWMKDFYYSSLPFMSLDKNLAKKIILWFNEFGVRPKGNIREGGVNHSLSLSVASIMLAGLYYQNTNDKQFFLENRELNENWDRIISDMISSRDDDIWLFPSLYISDGPIIPDSYHTGSNVCAWFAIKSYARLQSEVYNNPKKAANLMEIAGKVKSAIMEKCTIEGPFGRQFIEAAYRDGRQAPMESDGEESDVTLMPYYGFLSWDDPIYLNYMKFSVSEHNTLYRPHLKAIGWGGVPSTAPGYVKGICAATDRESLLGENGYLTEIRRITDADGSVWWWTYRNRNPQYGNPARGIIGKSGWFSGVYSVIYAERHMEFLGLD